MSRTESPSSFPRVGLAFEGQGKQYVGMGKDFYEKSLAAQRIFDRAEHQLPGIQRLCFEGPEEKLNQTVYAQPAIFTMELAAYAAHGEAADGLANNAAAGAGHSMGEVPLLVAAHALTLEQGLHLIKHRALLMQHAGKERPGAMGVIMGLAKKGEEEAKQIEALLERIREDHDPRKGKIPHIGVSSHTSNNQHGVTGEKNMVHRAIEEANAQGAKIAKILDGISIASHSPLMTPAKRGMERIVRELSIQDVAFPIYVNVTGNPVSKAEELRKAIPENLVKPVHWRQSIMQMAEEVDVIYGYGPSKALQGMIKENASGVPVHVIYDMKSLYSILALTS